MARAIQLARKAVGGLVVTMAVSWWMFVTTIVRSFSECIVTGAVAEPILGSTSKQPLLSRSVRGRYRGYQSIIQLIGARRSRPVL